MPSTLIDGVRFCIPTPFTKTVEKKPYSFRESVRVLMAMSCTHCETPEGYYIEDLFDEAVALLNASRVTGARACNAIQAFKIEVANNCVDHLDAKNCAEATKKLAEHFANNPGLTEDQIREALTEYGATVNPYNITHYTMTRASDVLKLSAINGLILFAFLLAIYALLAMGPDGVPITFSHFLFFGLVLTQAISFLWHAYEAYYTPFVRKALELGDPNDNGDANQPLKVIPALYQAAIHGAFFRQKAIDGTSIADDNQLDTEVASDSRLPLGS